MLPQLHLDVSHVHLWCWSAFGVTLVIAHLRGRNGAAAADTVVATKEMTAPFSRALVAFHMLGLAVMYCGIGMVEALELTPAWFQGQPLFGATVIVAGMVLMILARLYFKSWRFLAKLEEGHVLATGGPFRYVRHPLYTGMDLLALGTAIMAPTPVICVGCVLVVLGGDLRARAEERLLEQAFGLPYREYCRRTSRFIPGIY